MNENRIYSVIPKIVEGARKITQPYGRMAAQASHAEASLRYQLDQFASDKPFVNIPTIILECRDEAELKHVARLLEKKKLPYTWYYDENPEAYGTVAGVLTALAVVATKEQTVGILDYLPKLGDGLK